MDIVWIVMKYNKVIGRLHSHHYFYKVCATEETAIKYTDKLNELDGENHYYYHLEMVR